SGAHASVGDDVHVTTGLIEIADPGAGGVGDRRRLRNTHAEHTPGGAGGTGTDPDQHAHRSRPHQVQGGGVGGTATDDDRNLAVGDDLLEVEWLLPRRDVLGRHDGSLDDQDVQSTLECHRRELLDPLGGEAGCGDDSGRLDLRHPLADQVGLDRLQVDLLHPSGGLVGLQLGDLGEVRFRILVASPQTLEIEDAQAAEATDLDGGGGAERSVHGGSQHREFEFEGVELPADVDVVGIPSPSAGDDGYVVESVGLTTRLADTDVDFHALFLRR